MTSYQPLVSIIINVHNNLEYLPKTIQSGLDQTYPNFELLVYDNYSSEDIQSAVKKFGNKVRFCRSEIFLTLGQARNEALKKAKGELIAFLDSDDLFLPDKLIRQVPLFEDPKVGLVISNVVTFFNDNNLEIPGFESPPPQGMIFRDLLKNYFIPFVTAVFRKSAIGEDPKNWFPDTFNICTDFDLFLKISHQFEVRYINEILAKWRSHGENWSTRKNYLLPIEKFAMIPRILVYEPDLFKLYSKETKRLLSNTHSEMANVFWQQSLKKEALMECLHAYFLSFRPKFFLKAIMIPFSDFQTFKKARKQN